MSATAAAAALSAPEGAAATEGAVDVPKGHPFGLYILFFTEAWERFSYYGMRALLVLYMINHLQWQPSESSSVYKWYTSLVYLTPLLGGFLADRFLGLRASIVVGGILMAIGQFLLMFEPLPFFYTALAFLIAGNGFFKPNISTLVGKMYLPNDSRRDGAFTIFYMGINTGAFFAPIVCAFLRQKYGFHYGFGVAGVGMCIGLTAFLLGQRRILADVRAAGNDLKVGAKKDEPAAGAAPTPAEDADEKEPGRTGLAGVVAKVMPLFMITVGVLVPLREIVAVVQGEAKLVAVFMPSAFALISLAMGLILLKIKGAAKDKSIVIFVLFMFVVLFWMAFEQAGNALNIWADVNTDLHIGSFEYPAEWFQSVNPLLIISVAPVFAFMWIWLGKKGVNISTPAKMLLAMVLMAASFGVMVFAAVAEHATENRETLAAVPAGVNLKELNAGRLDYDAAKKELVVRGVLPVFAVNEALKVSATPAYLKAVEQMEERAKGATVAAPVTMPFPEAPATFQLPMDEEKAKKAGVAWDPGARALTLSAPMDAGTRVALTNAGAPAEWRTALRSLETKSQGARVSGFWLFLSYFLATLGELCLSPVGLSMVTKLAPARFASLFMGVWLLASSVAQYVGGGIGESWGKITPLSYFTLFVWTSLIGAVALLALVKPLKNLMHRVT